MFLFPLGAMLSIKETLFNWPVSSPEGTNHCPSHGVLKETLLTLTQPWPQQCLEHKPASSWYHLWTITTLVSTHAELKILLEHPLILQNYKLMVIFRMTPEIFYLQRNQRSFLSHLVKKLSTKETLPSWPVLCQEVIDLCPSPGVWRETLSTLTPPWPPPCWAHRPASSWYPQWTITIVGSTPVELRTQLGCPLTQLNSKSMVIFGCTERYFIYRTSSNCSFFLWWLSCQPRRVSTTDVCSQ